MRDEIRISTLKVVGAPPVGDAIFPVVVAEQTSATRFVFLGPPTRNVPFVVGVPRRRLRQFPSNGEQPRVAW